MGPPFFAKTENNIVSYPPLLALEDLSVFAPACGDDDTQGWWRPVVSVQKRHGRSLRDKIVCVSDRKHRLKKVISEDRSQNKFAA